MPASPPTTPRTTAPKKLASLTVVATLVLTALGVTTLYTATSSQNAVATASTTTATTAAVTAQSTAKASAAPLTNRTNLTFKGSKYTSTYHVFAKGLNPKKRIGMMIYADGSGEWGLKKLHKGDHFYYLLGGKNGLINVAKRHNMVLVTPLSPNKNCEDGDGSCWYYGDSVGYAQWAQELVQSVQKKYNVDKSRVAMGGYSSGAQLATEWWVPGRFAQRTMTDGVVVAISYGGSPKMKFRTSGKFRNAVHMSWDVGSKDESYTDGSSPYGVKAGYRFYTKKGFSTSLRVVPGLGHERDGQFGKIMDREIRAHVRSAG